MNKIITTATAVLTPAATSSTEQAPPPVRCLSLALMAHALSPSIRRARDFAGDQESYGEYVSRDESRRSKRDKRDRRHPNPDIRC